MERRKILIDCDVGVDDALALILAFRSPELCVKAVTGVHGNVPLRNVSENIKKVLSLLKPQEPPLVADGAAAPLKGRGAHAYSVHGETGLAEARIETEEGNRWWHESPYPAEDLIVELACRDPDEITLVATGPLTNVARGVEKNLRAMKKLRSVIVMGGAVRIPGNITPHAEFNFYADPLAAQIVFESGLPLTLVPLDVTHQVFFTPSLLEERVIPLDNALSRFMIDAIGYDIERREFRRKGVIYLHDPLAVGVAIDEDLVKRKRLALRVETEAEDRFGAILENPNGSPLDVCLEVEAKAFLDLFLSRLRSQTREASEGSS